MVAVDGAALIEGEDSPADHAVAFPTGAGARSGLAVRRVRRLHLRSEYSTNASFIHIHQDLQPSYLSLASAPHRFGGLVRETCSVDDRHVLHGRNDWRFVAEELNRRR